MSTSAEPMTFICPWTFIDLEFERRASLSACLLIIPFREPAAAATPRETREPGQGVGQHEEYRNAIVDRTGA
jgi:hypothetical protein